MELTMRDIFRISNFEKSSLRMTNVMFLDAFWEQTFSAALPPACEDRAAALCPHPRTKAVLPFPCSLGWLVSAFHKTEKEPGTI
jgi:hypothetical protein